MFLILYFVFLDQANANSQKIISVMLTINIFLVALIFLESAVQLPVQILKSVNDTKYLPVIQATGYIIVAPIIMYITTQVYDYGIFGIALAMFCGILVTAITIVSRLIYTLKPENIFKQIQTK